MNSLYNIINTLRCKWRQFQSSIQDKPKKKLTVKQYVGFVVLFILMMATLFWSYTYETTGRHPLPFLNKIEYILPPRMNTDNQTYDQVINFVQSDDTAKTQYGKGFNCVDATFKIWRAATWKGIAAYPVVIQYYEAPGHMIIVFPTNDQGDVLIEPQCDCQVTLRVGDKYNNRKVRGFYVLDYAPVPLDNSPQYDMSLKSE